MSFTFATLVLVNTYSWIGGQGYCSYDFALIENEADYSKVEITLRPVFEAGTLATGLDLLDDVTIKLDHIGGSRADSQATAQVETDCAITGLDIVSATAIREGRTVDLLAAGAIGLDRYEPLDITLKGKREDEP